MDSFIALRSLKTAFLSVFKISVVLLAGSGCESTTSSVPNITYSKEYFPNKPGDQWVYNVYDSVLNTQEIVTVRVIGTKELPDKNVAKVWLFEYPDVTDTSYVVTLKDTILFYAPDLISIDHVYLTPLRVGSTWTGGWTNDQYAVQTSGSVIVNTMRFDSAYEIKETAHSLNFFRKKDEWFVPGLGMVERNWYEYNLSPPENKVWKLKSSNLTSTK